jgi:hypothetical protein
MNKRGTKINLGLITLFILFMASSTRASSPMLYIYNGPESTQDKRYSYHWEILKTALDRTIKKYGPYQMLPSKSMTEQRQAFELEHSTGKLTVMCLGSTPEREKRLLPVRIPVDKNLNGYELFLIRKEDSQKFKAIKNLNQLKNFRFGLGLGWIDTEILRKNGFKVITGSNYNGLFEMLLNGRFDVFPRSADEILAEFEARKIKMPNLMIEESILLKYPLPMYFWFPNTDKGKELAKRAEEGMKIMIADNTFDRIFSKHQSDKINRLKLKNRKIFKLNNPFIAAGTSFKDKKLWFDPQTYIFTNNKN